MVIFNWCALYPFNFMLYQRPMGPKAHRPRYYGSGNKYYIHSILLRAVIENKKGPEHRLQAPGYKLSGPTVPRVQRNMSHLFRPCKYINQLGNDAFGL